MSEMLSGLIFILVFSCPGFLIQKALRLIKETSKSEISDYDKSIWAFFYSFVVLMINLIVILIMGKEIKTLTQILDLFDSIVFLFKYIALSTLSSFVVLFLTWLLTHVVIFEIANKFNQVKHNSILLPYPTIWESLIASKIDVMPSLSDACIEILKGGEVITQGSIHSLSISTTSKKDILLTDIEAVRVYLDNDKTTPDEFKMFPKVICEYYDLEFDILIRVYDNTRWLENFRKH